MWTGPKELETRTLSTRSAGFGVFFLGYYLEGAAVQDSLVDDDLDECGVGALGVVAAVVRVVGDEEEAGAVHSAQTPRPEPQLQRVQQLTRPDVPQLQTPASQERNNYYLSSFLFNDAAKHQPQPHERHA